MPGQPGRSLGRLGGRRLVVGRGHAFRRPFPPADIRAAAKSAAEQLRALMRESGEEAGICGRAYLAILEHFLKETAPAGSPANAPALSPDSKPKPAQDEE